MQELVQTSEHVSLKPKRNHKEDVKIEFERGKCEVLISVEEIMIIKF